MNRLSYFYRAAANKMKIIPAIDLIGGKCVRLTQGDYGKMKVYREDPLEVAQEFEQADAEFLHLVDLDGAKEGRVINWQAVERIQANTSLKVDFGGGVKTDEEVKRLLEMEVNQINVGSLAAREPRKFKRWLREFGPENFILSADVRHDKVQIAGWQEETPLSIYELVQSFETEGLMYVACTDILSDGMLNGPNFGLYKMLKNKFPHLRIIASGGISSIDDLKELHFIKVHGAIIGKAIYEGKITLDDVKQCKLAD